MLLTPTETRQHPRDGRGNRARQSQDRRHGLREALQLSSETPRRPRSRCGDILVPCAGAAVGSTALHESHWYV